MIKHTKSYIPGYPRPQFVRKEWQLLDGRWDFRFDKDDLGESKGFQKGFEKECDIVVPFPYQCKKSEVNKLDESKAIWYQLKFVPEYLDRENILTFEGADYETFVWINGKFVGQHKGAYSRFSFNVSKFLKRGENLLVVKCLDSRRCDQPRGKQSWINEKKECFYTPFNGIYKSVWIDAPKKDNFLKSVKITPNYNDYSVSFDIFANEIKENTYCKIIVTSEDENISECNLKLNKEVEKINLNIESDKIFFKRKEWSPGAPNLYDVKFILFENNKVVDEVQSYFGFREIRINNQTILLNNNTLYLKLILDQGYYEDSLTTTPSEEDLIRDIELTKKLGFNGVRKHQKTEDERYLYYADIMGLFVWCELPSNYLYNDEAIENITFEWNNIVREYYNHPSIITWVIFNESWGVGNISHNESMQNLSISLYYLTKSYDQMRPVICNDGWEHTVSDILTIHNYQQDPAKFAAYFDSLEKTVNGHPHGRGKLPFAMGFEYRGQPIIISEYGGTSLIEDSQDGWGYGNKLNSKEELIQKYDDLTSVIKGLPHVTGYCYTQLTDVMQEMNGFLTIDRKPKIDIEEICEINEK